MEHVYRCAACVSAVFARVEVDGGATVTLRVCLCNRIRGERQTHPHGGGLNERGVGGERECMEIRL